MALVAVVAPVVALVGLACRAAEGRAPAEAPAEVAEPTPVVEPVREPEPALAAEPAAPLTPAVVTGGVDFDAAELAALLEHSPLPPVPDDPTNAVFADPAAARLGQALFFDERLSRDGDVSCATCHDPGRGWADGRQLAVATGRLERHSMTLWNVAHNRWFFWDGRADSLWSQALQPLEEPREHATSRLAVAHVVAEDADLRRAYEAVFGELPPLEQADRFPPEGRPVDGQPDHPHARAWASMDEADREAVNRVFADVGKAIAAFERQLVSGRSPFDVFVEGVRERDARKQRSLSEAARRGFKLFAGKARCHLCHIGPNFTDREFHNNRLPPLEGATSLDPGRFKGIELVQEDPFNGIGAYSDEPDGAAREKVGFLRRVGHNWAEFKTPSLRNVAVTAPYMHEGQFATLEDVLHFYSTLEDATPPHHVSEKLLVPVGLDEGEIDDLIAFLEALTDVAIDPALERAPESASLAPPESGG